MLKYFHFCFESCLGQYSTNITKHSSNSFSSFSLILIITTHSFLWSAICFSTKKHSLVTISAHQSPSENLFNKELTVSQLFPFSFLFTLILSGMLLVHVI